MRTLDGVRPFAALTTGDTDVNARTALVSQVRETKMASVADLGSLQRLVGIVADGHLRELELTGET